MQYLGCFADSKNRDMYDYNYMRYTMTVEKCAVYCLEKGTTYFGVQVNMPDVINITLFRSLCVLMPTLYFKVSVSFIEHILYNCAYKWM